MPPDQLILSFQPNFDSNSTKYCSDCYSLEVNGLKSISIVIHSTVGEDMSHRSSNRDLFKNL